MAILSEKSVEMLKNFKGMDNILQKFDNYTYNIELCMVPAYDLYEYDKENFEREYAKAKANLESLESNDTLSKNDNSNLGAGTALGDLTYSNNSAKILSNMEQQDDSSPENYQRIKNILDNRITIYKSGVSADYGFDDLVMETYIAPGCQRYDKMTSTVSFKFKMKEVAGNTLTNKLMLAAGYYGYTNGYANMPLFLIIDFKGYDTETKELNNSILSSTGDKRQLIYRVSVIKSDVAIGDSGTEYSMELAPTSSTFAYTIENQMLLGCEVSNELPKTMGEALVKLKEIFEDKIKDNMKKALTDQEGKSHFQEIYTSEGSDGGDKPLEITFGEGLDKVKGFKLDIKSFKVDDTSRLDNIFNKVLQSVTDPKEHGYITNIEYKTKMKGSYNDRTYYKTIAKINFIEEKSLETVKSQTVRHESDNDIRESFEKMTAKYQEKVLSEIIANKQMVTKYEYRLSGKDCSVINIDLKDENLWFANICVASGRYNEKNNIIQAEENKKDKEAKDKNPYKKAPSNGKIDINDLYNKLSETEKINYIKEVSGYDRHGSVVTTDDKTSVYVDRTKKDENHTVKEGVENTSNSIEDYIGWKNWVNSAFLIQIDMDIIGDPIWLKYKCDSYNYIDKEYGITSNPYIALQVNSFYFMDENDVPKKDDVNSIIAPYMIYKVVSTFSKGKFVQKLTGARLPPFVSRLLSDQEATNAANGVIEQRNEQRERQKEAEKASDMPEDNETLTKSSSNEEL